MPNQIIQNYIKRYSGSRSITRGKSIFRNEDVEVGSIDYKEEVAVFYVNSQSSDMQYEVEITDFYDP